MAIAKIIYLMSACPAYDLYINDPRPKLNWDTPDGSWVGIWGYDWSDIIGQEVLKLTDKFEYEVWQPDLRADRLYSHKFSNGLVHKLFPAQKKYIIHRLRKKSCLVSSSIYESLLDEIRKSKIILHLDGISKGISRDILNLFPDNPIAVEFLGEKKFPRNTIFNLNKNLLGKIFDLHEHFITKKLFRKVDIISCCNERTQKNLRRYFKQDIYLIPLGTDFDFWKSQKPKEQIRRRLGVDEKKKIFLSSSRLVKLKQIDKVIEILKKMDENFDFLYIISGHGEKTYERYLHTLSEPLVKKGKIKFVGYVRDKQLRDLYNVADLFVITSISEGAPDAAKKALAMEVPIFSTNTGYVAELLLKYNAGIVVPIKDYEMWRDKINEILNGEKIEIMKREVAKRYFHWPNVSSQYVAMYEKLYENYYSHD